MKPLKSSSKKRTYPTTAQKLREPGRKRKALLTMPGPRAVETNDPASRRAEHRKRRDEINVAYHQCMVEVFNQHGSLAQKRTMIKRNVKQFSAALLGWELQALEILEAGQRAAFLQMQPNRLAN